MTKAAALRIERIALSEMKPHPKNPRSHPPEGSPSWNALARSIEHDYFDPLVLNQRNGLLVSGHLRHKVLVAGGFTHADVSVVDYDEPTHLARIVAANTLLGEFLAAALGELAREIETAGLDPALAGWDSKDLAALLDGPTVDDDTAETVILVSRAEEIQARWQVNLGDCFAIGEHRLLCGDCTDLANWERLACPDKDVDLVWTDPPYNVDYDSIQRRRLDLRVERNGAGTYTRPDAILNDDLTPEQYSRLLVDSLRAAFMITKPGGAVYVAHADSHGLQTRLAAAEAGWHIAQNLVWVKNGFTLGRQDYQWQHEPILYGWKPGAAHYWQGGFAQSTVVDDEAVDLAKASKTDLIAIIRRLRNARETSVIREARNNDSAPLHPTVKPLPLVARQVWNSSRPGETVAELFAGSGTTLLAAEQTGRRCIATELEPKFCAVILERLSAHGLAVLKLDNRRASVAGNVGGNDGSAS